MAKKSIFVISSDGEKVPFLRGILVQSLARIGLSFDDAYAAAQRVRESLSGLEQIDTASLRARVAQLLDGDFGPEVGAAYRDSQQQGGEVMVRTSAREAPFSVGILSRYLEGCAISRKQALKGARTVAKALHQRDTSVIDTKMLRRIVFSTLKQECCPAAADRYLSRYLFEASGKPLIVVVGGAGGAGKSTVAANLAYHLEISRTQSTDIIREIVRCYVPQHKAPTLGYSSFDAWRGLSDAANPVGSPTFGSRVIEGFLSQIAAIQAALEATIGRAVKERQDLVLDGVHVIPSRLDLIGVEQNAVIVPVMLGVPTLDRLSRQLGRRSREQPERLSARHREKLSAIWEIQAYLLDQAEKRDIPVILNWSVEDTAQEILLEVVERISERFPPDPKVLT